MWADLHGDVMAEFGAITSATEAQVQAALDWRWMRWRDREAKRSEREATRLRAKKAAERAPLPKPRPGPKPRALLGAHPLQKTKEAVCVGMAVRRAKRAAQKGR